MTAPAPEIQIRQLDEMTDLMACSSIELAVWGEGGIPAHLLRAVTHMGGLAVGALLGTELVGFVFGFLGQLERDGVRQLVHHSHVMAVLPQYRGFGIAVKLKQEQARLCREQGLQLMTWTFDPLRARNARLNIERLGATVAIYEPMHYGPMFDLQNGQLDSDRLLAEWNLTASPQRFSGDLAALPVVLGAAESGGPAEPRFGLEVPALHLSVPQDLDGLLASQPLLAVRWREAVRDTMLHYLARGYRATRFLNSGYVLEAE